MKIINRIICFVLCVVLIGAICGCGEKGEKGETGRSEFAFEITTHEGDIKYLSHKELFELAYDNEKEYKWNYEGAKATITGKITDVSYAKKEDFFTNDGGRILDMPGGLTIEIDSKYLVHLSLQLDAYDKVVNQIEKIDIDEIATVTFYLKDCDDVKENNPDSIYEISAFYSKSFGEIEAHYTLPGYIWDYLEIKD